VRTPGPHLDEAVVNGLEAEERHEASPGTRRQGVNLFGRLGRKPAPRENRRDLLAADLADRETGIARNGDRSRDVEREGNRCFDREGFPSVEKGRVIEKTSSRGQPVPRGFLESGEPPRAAEAAEGSRIERVQAWRRRSFGRKDSHRATDDGGQGRRHERATGVAALNHDRHPLPLADMHGPVKNRTRAAVVDEENVARRDFAADRLDSHFPARFEGRPHAFPRHLDDPKGALVSNLSSFLGAVRGG